MKWNETETIDCFVKQNRAKVECNTFPVNTRSALQQILMTRLLNEQAELSGNSHHIPLNIPTMALE